MNKEIPNTIVPEKNNKQENLIGMLVEGKEEELAKEVEKRFDEMSNEDEKNDNSKEN